MLNKTPIKHNIFLQALEAVSKYLGVDIITPIVTLRKRPQKPIPNPDIKKLPSTDINAKKAEL